MNKTLFVSFLAGPGCGKSSTALSLAGKLKLNRYSCEFIHEFAKWEVYRENWNTLKNQTFITSNQYELYKTVDGKVDIAICDSSILLGLIYPSKDIDNSFEQWVLKLYKEFNNINIYLERDDEKHPYKKVGRTQDFEEALEKDREAKDVLDKYNIPYITAKFEGKKTVKDLYSLVLEKLNESKEVN
jgi:hypothetical protein